MKTQTRIFQHLIIGFIIVNMALVIFALNINTKINTREKQIQEMGVNFQPSINTLSELKANYEKVKKLVSYWMLSPTENDSLFRDEFNRIYAESIYPLTAELLLMADKWNEEDSRFMDETAMLLKDSLYSNLIFLVKASNSARSEEKPLYSELIKGMEEGEIIFLLSEIDQNLSYLIGKKQAETNSILRASISFKNDLQYSLIYLVMTILIVTTFSLVWYYKYIISAFQIISSSLESLSQGRIPENIPEKRDHAFALLYSHMNRLFNYLSNLVKLSNHILKKDFSGDIDPLGQHDQLGIALVNLQNSLKQATDEENKRIKEDHERQWVSEGIAKINDILRISEDAIDELSYQIIKEIVSYTGSSLGALFIINNETTDNIFLEMSATYAYDRKKHLKKTISLGEGLVGRCANESETLFLTEIPENYLSIQSGLGENKPASLLLVPLKLNDSVYGVIELASFNTFEPFQIRFIETVCENIAITISKVKINIRTSLLLEQTRKQTEELSIQEDEMRLNMEELRANQEQSAIREESLIKEIEKLKSLLNRS